MLKPCKSVQETSEEVLDFKAAEAQCLIAISTDKLSIEVYEIQFFRIVFNPIHVYMFGLSFLTTLNIYKDCFKGHQRLRKCEANLC